MPEADAKDNLKPDALNQPHGGPAARDELVMFVKNARFSSCKRAANLDHRSARK